MAGLTGPLAPPPRFLRPGTGMSPATPKYTVLGPVTGLLIVQAAVEGWNVATSAWPSPS